MLVDALAAAEQGAPRFAALTGEPGIGKSRLCGELAARAVANGAKVVVGRCSQDDGAPPLWPWRQVLRGLGAELAVPDADDEGAEFRTWEAITDRVTEAARTRPWWWCSTTCTGPTGPASGCSGCSRRRWRPVAC